MSKPRLRDLIAARKISLRTAPPKSRDRIRQRLHALELCAVLRKRGRTT